MEPILYQTTHLIKSEDLNHHGTLYAGRSAEWFVESGFVAAASLTRPENIVCLRIHGMTFAAPIHLGDLACFESKIVLTGKSRLVAYIQVKKGDDIILRGFITFVHVDKQGKTLPHGKEIIPIKPEDIALHEEALKLN